MTYMSSYFILKYSQHKRIISNKAPGFVFAKNSSNLPGVFLEIDLMQFLEDFGREKAEHTLVTDTSLKYLSHKEFVLILMSFERNSVKQVKSRGGKRIKKNLFLI